VKVGSSSHKYSHSYQVIKQTIIIIIIIIIIIKAIKHNARDNGMKEKDIIKFLFSRYPLLNFVKITKRRNNRIFVTLI